MLDLIAGRGAAPIPASTHRTVASIRAASVRARAGAPILAGWAFRTECDLLALLFLTCGALLLHVSYPI